MSEKAVTREKDKLITVSIRMGAAEWLKAKWQAASVGLSRATWARNTLTAASQHAEPPKDNETLIFLDAGTPERLADWQRLAREKGEGRSLNALIAVLLDRMSGRGTRPA